MARQPPVIQPASGKSIIINPCQRLNPVVECIRNVPKEFADIPTDYQVGRTTGVLFLSLRYHRLHPEYIHQRIERLGHSYNLRILLLMCDISEHQEPIRELTRICLLNNITVVVAWSADEAGQYLAAYKLSEHRPPTLIRERVDKTPAALLRTALTSIPRVNKTDVETLRTSFGSFARIARADAAQIARLPGFGPKKVARLKDAFERPFRTGTTSALALATVTAPPPPPPHTDPSSSSSSSAAGAEAAPPPATIEHPGSRSGAEPSQPNPTGDDGRRALGSPAWDIELDLNSPSPSPPSAEEGPPRLPSSSTGPSLSKRVREESPPWDIEEVGPALEPQAQDDDHDEPSSDLEVHADADVDVDPAPALRAKRRRA
ncbi:DNA repair protein rad10 [Russula earlei]|uniref:DNA repair protein rad10 n=1 Tax=Russula earlei TaxID=71964 RepID=A0ACC0UKY7_9AGAM|nr:DNA repair protein rad10 [Russula earlei]